MDVIKERYKRGYKFLAENSTDKDVIADYLENEFHKHWNIDKNKIEVLDIGCAEGNITRCLMDNICRPAKKVRFTLVEPSRALLAQAAKKLKCEKIPLNMTYERYISNTGNTPKYDLVFSCHSIYHTGLKSIRRMYSSLSKGGVLLIIVSSSDDPFIKIKKLFPRIVTIAGDSVMGEIKRLGYKKIVKDSKRKLLNVNSCLNDNGELTEDGKNLASLLFYDEYENLTSAQQKAILRFFEKFAVGGIEYFNDFIWVFK